MIFFPDGKEINLSCPNVLDMICKNINIKKKLPMYYDNNLNAISTQEISGNDWPTVIDVLIQYAQKLLSDKNNAGYILQVINTIYKAIDICDSINANDNDTKDLLNIIDNLLNKALHVVEGNRYDV